ncbi:MAG: hypothetical protein JRG97_15625 [Deltaproteobacteria bacterium]|nr:hypothetical protein [Deltaproteobacteria bacterium]MBW2142463.1 hypothetical protein [Deltaproteobacteria bacterium]
MPAAEIKKERLDRLICEINGLRRDLTQLAEKNGYISGLIDAEIAQTRREIKAYAETRKA